MSGTEQNRTGSSDGENLPILGALRHRWLKSPNSFLPLPSGGNHAAPWPPRAAAFAREFLPHCRPLNFALLADELARRLDFHRSRATVAAWCRGHLPELVASKPRPGPKSHRRRRAGAIGELWLHDSSLHDWWQASSKPILLLTVDDHSRKIVAGSFIPHPPIAPAFAWPTILAHYSY